MQSAFRSQSRRALVALVLPLLVAGCFRLESAPAPKAVGGEIDLRRWDFERNGPVRLNGEWEFHWGRLPNAAGRLPTATPAPGYLELPGTWTGHTVGGMTLPALGYATYRLRVLLPPGVHGLAIRTDSAGTAFTLHVDGVLLARNGAVGTDAAASRPEYRKAIAILPPVGERSEWVLAVSNFHYRKGGPWNSIELGTAPDAHAAGERQAGKDLFLIGSLLIMGLYHLVLFGLRRKDRTALYYALFCALIIFRQASTSGRLLLDLWPGLPWGVLIRVEFISFFLCISAGAAFARKLFPAEIPRVAVRVLAGVGLLASVFTVFATPRLSSYLINPYQFWTLGGSAYLLWRIGIAAKHRREGAWLFLAGTAVLFVAAANDTLYNLEVLRWAYLIAYGFVTFTFAQAVVLSRRFVRFTVIAETLSESLERKVEERTTELAAKNQQLEATIDELRATRSQLQQFGLSVRVGNDYVVFPYADIHYLSAREGKTVVHTARGDHEVPRPLKEIEALLTDERFQRIHRQYVINVTCVANVAHIGHGSYIAELRGRGGAPLPVSRIHAPILKRRLGIVE